MDNIKINAKSLLKAWYTNGVRCTYTFLHINIGSEEDLREGLSQHKGINWKYTYC